MRSTRDPDMPVGRLTRVKDFLPPPEKLAPRADNVKVTLNLKRSCVAFFKREAALHHTKYQQMIRELLNHYAERYA